MTGDSTKPRPLTVNELISKLEHVPSDAPVSYSDGRVPSEPMSWRGDYAQLTLNDGGTPCDVATLVRRLRASIGKTFTGYKGGDYVMDGDTPVWADSWGACDHKAITDVECLPSPPEVSHLVVLRVEIMTDDDAHELAAARYREERAQAFHPGAAPYPLPGTVRAAPSAPAAEPARVGAGDTMNGWTIIPVLAFGHVVAEVRYLHTITDGDDLRYLANRISEEVLMRMVGGHGG